MIVSEGNVFELLFYRRTAVSHDETYRSYEYVTFCIINFAPRFNATIIQNFDYLEKKKSSHGITC